MSEEWGRTLDGEVIGFVNEEPNVDQSLLAPGKPRILPIVVESEAFDPITQVQEGPTYEVEAARIVRRFTSRAKNEDEIATMIAAKDAAIEAEFTRLYQAPIMFTVGGVEREFHGDDQAVENIMGSILRYLVDPGAPDPRSWTPKGSFDPISISKVEIGGLGVAIAARKDALFNVKKARQKALSEMTDPAAIDAVDPTAGWDIS